MMDNAIVRGQVEVLEKEAELNEALQKESRLKKVEEIIEIERQLALKKVPEAETGHTSKRLEEAVGGGPSGAKRGPEGGRSEPGPDPSVTKGKPADEGMNLAPQREMSHQLQAARTEALTESNSQQLQWQEPKGRLLQAMSGLNAAGRRRGWSKGPKDSLSGKDSFRSSGVLEDDKHAREKSRPQDFLYSFPVRCGVLTFYA
ncbi:hypothetical protein EYF80_062306 [Liparis tanakae]|uniref:Uncharacterized protein n=1 Tax=Liparis tanakae TaxID=230148 RepID=A0A4Z2EF86_9TELE|nr:hypothetical protein EYF80_062306 [Liparis tanakae]